MFLYMYGNKIGAVLKIQMLINLRSSAPEPRLYTIQHSTRDQWSRSCEVERRSVVNQFKSFLFGEIIANTSKWRVGAKKGENKHRYQWVNRWKHNTRCIKVCNVIVHSLHFTVQHRGWVPTGRLYDKMTLIQQKPEALKPERRNIQMNWTEANITSNNASFLLEKMSTKPLGKIKHSHNVF